jgi:hypothetical protein
MVIMEKTRMTLAGKSIFRTLILAPVFGIVLFLILYVIATEFYPGGSQADMNAKGFSWINNYWCNLLNENAINGQFNAARPIALFAMGVLSCSLALFWIIFPSYAEFNIRSGLVMKAAGILAMIIGMFSFTQYHDMVINLATFTGLIPLSFTFVGLYRAGWRKLYWGGLFILVLIALNNILYYSEGLLHFLPVFQKFTFLYFLLWVCLINTRIYDKAVHRVTKS